MENRRNWEAWDDERLQVLSDTIFIMSPCVSQNFGHCLSENAIGFEVCPHGGSMLTLCQSSVEFIIKLVRVNLAHNLIPSLSDMVISRPLLIFGPPQKNIFVFAHYFSTNPPNTKGHGKKSIDFWRKWSMRADEECVWHLSSLCYLLFPVVG